MSYEENVRAILQCCFYQCKDEIIENAVKAIMALKQEPVVVNPIDPMPVMPNPIPYIPPYYTTPNVGQYITCTGTPEDLKNSSKSNIIDDIIAKNERGK